MAKQTKTTRLHFAIASIRRQWTAIIMSNFAFTSNKILFPPQHNRTDPPLRTQYPFLDTSMTEMEPSQMFNLSEAGNDAASSVTMYTPILRQPVTLPLTTRTHNAGYLSDESSHSRNNHRSLTNDEAGLGQIAAMLRNFQSDFKIQMQQMDQMNTCMNDFKIQMQQTDNKMDKMGDNLTSSITKACNNLKAGITSIVQECKTDIIAAMHKETAKIKVYKFIPEQEIDELQAVYCTKIDNSTADTQNNHIKGHKETDQVTTDVTLKTSSICIDDPVTDLHNNCTVDAMDKSKHTMYSTEAEIENFGPDTNSNKKKSAADLHNNCTVDQMNENKFNLYNYDGKANILKIILSTQNRQNYKTTDRSKWTANKLHKAEYKKTSTHKKRHKNKKYFPKMELSEVTQSKMMPLCNNTFKNQVNKYWNLSFSPSPIT